MHLVGLVSLLFARGGVLGVELGFAHVRIRARIGLDPLPGAAQQLADRQSYQASQQVPQGAVHGAGNVFRQAVAERRQLIHPVPQLLAVERVLADQHPFHRFLDVAPVAAHHVPLQPFVSRYAGDGVGALALLSQHTVPPLVRSLPRRAAERDDLDVGNLHTTSHSLRSAVSGTLDSPWMSSPVSTSGARQIRTGSHHFKQAA